MSCRECIPPTSPLPKINTHFLYYVLSRMHSTTNTKIENTTIFITSCVACHINLFHHRYILPSPAPPKVMKSSRLNFPLTRPYNHKLGYSAIHSTSSNHRSIRAQRLPERKSAESDDQKKKKKAAALSTSETNNITLPRA